MKPKPSALHGGFHHPDAVETSETVEGLEAALDGTPCLFPFFLTGLHRECIGVAPADHDGVPVVRLTALRLKVDLDREEPDLVVAEGDLVGAEGLVEIMTLQRAYLAAGWTLHGYAFRRRPSGEVLRAAYDHLTMLLPEGVGIPEVE